MARLVDHTYVTEDEGWDVGRAMVNQLQNAVDRLGELDAYNNQYVLHFSIDQIDDPIKEVEYGGDQNDE